MDSVKEYASFEEQKKNKNPSLFEDYLVKKFNDNERMVIYEVCSLSEIRNRAAHEEIITIKEIIDNRPMIIGKINSFIALILKYG